MTSRLDSTPATRTDDAVHPARVESIWLEAVDGPGKGARFLLERGSATVGSGSKCDFTVDDATVSRVHATVELKAGGVRVVDEGSHNGTFYLSARVTEAFVPIDGSLRLGRTTVQLRAASRPAAPLSDEHELAGLMGWSVPMRQLFAVIEQLAASDASAVIEGETGAGKHTVARAIHALSPRKAEPFVEFACGAPVSELIESELFGHARGAFTGASADRAGIFELAGAGTVCLSGVDELPLALQPKLLRVLESRAFQRVGDGTSRAMQARVLALSSRPLRQQLRTGAFREDLYYRLAVTEVRVAPLRERMEDVPRLAEHFAHALTGTAMKLGLRTTAELLSYDWPGNVRELRNRVQRLVSLGGDERAPAAAGDTSFDAAQNALIAVFERDYLEALLRRCEGNLSRAARDARISRARLYRLLERHGLTNLSKERGDE